MREEDDDAKRCGDATTMPPMMMMMMMMMMTLLLRMFVTAGAYHCSLLVSLFGGSGRLAGRKREQLVDSASPARVMTDDQKQVWAAMTGSRVPTGREHAVGESPAGLGNPNGKVRVRWGAGAVRGAGEECFARLI